jgi:hypothetical protein
MLAAPRMAHLQTRGMLTVKMRIPKPPPADQFGWIMSPPDSLPEGTTWYIDGSLFDEARRFARRTGYAILVIGPDGMILGMGKGTPPEWVYDAAGAELWAFYMVTQLAAFLPAVVTDCLGIVQGLEAGWQSRPWLQEAPGQDLAHDRQQPRWRLRGRIRPDDLDACPWRSPHDW